MRPLQLKYSKNEKCIREDVQQVGGPQMLQDFEKQVGSLEFLLSAMANFCRVLSKNVRSELDF